MSLSDIVYKSRISKLCRPLYSGIGHILLFHRVSDQNKYTITKGLQISKSFLCKVIEYFIYEKIDIVNLDECYSRITSNNRAKRFVSFTFDDGYADNLTEALPIFEKYNIPFSVFLSTGYPDNKVVLWWYLLEEFIQTKDKIEFSIENIHYKYNTNTPEARNDAFWKIRRHILDCDESNLLQRLAEILNTDENSLFDLTRSLAMTWDQVKELSKNSLVTIGAHTINHLALSKLSEERAIEEMQNSQKIIQDKINKEVSYFAYPIGTSSEAGNREYKMAEKCNFKMAFTAEKGNIFKHHANEIYSLPRIGINENWQIKNIDFYINGLTSLRDRYNFKF